MKILQNEIIVSSENFGGKLSFIPFFLFFLTPASLHYYLPVQLFSLLPVQLLWLLSQPCALNDEFQHFILRFDKVTLQPCALNDEFQHFILRFAKIS